MKVFMALHLSMGILQKPALKDYWGEFWLTFTPGYGRVMTYDRFAIILSCLHFANNDNWVEYGQPGHDRLFKIRPVIDCVVPHFAAAYAPGKELCLDEMTVAFKGRSTFRLYNPKKTDRYGYKAFVLSEASTGYVLRWSLCNAQTGDDCGSMGATHLVVRQLMEPYTGKGHHVYMDSYYTGPAITMELAAKDTGLCGTVSSNRRGMPRDLRPALLPLRWGDDPVFMRHNKLLACAWHDTKRVTMLSSIHANSCVRKRICTKGSATCFRDINKPVCVDSYNTYMGGVDRADQRMKTYLFPHRAKKWYSHIFNALMSICVVNSHILYTKCTAGPHKPLKLFIQELIRGLLEGHKRSEGKRAGRPSQQALETPQRLTERHFMAKSTGSRPDCVVCSDRSRPQGRRQTHFRCAQCGVGLCAVPCFECYHTLKNFKLCHLDR
ncbi:piggyBac transposable element-derived protein 4-like [Pholidichthys leucotaenia]